MRPAASLAMPLRGRAGLARASVWVEAFRRLPALVCEFRPENRRRECGLRRRLRCRLEDVRAWPARPSG
jgi:hypothetical protein